MPKVMTCDICGRPDADEDHDGAILCTYHGAIRELDYQRDRYAEKRQWVRDVWFSELVKMRNEIKRLEQVVAENKPKEGG